MSIDEVLDDIKDGVENIDTGIPDIVPSSLDSTTVTTSDIENIPRISLEFINTVNKYRHLSVIYDIVKNSNKLTYSIAQEVFTMLPEVAPMAARLTSSPSTINKEVVQFVLDANMDSTSTLQQGKDKIHEYRVIVNQVLSSIDSIKEYITSFNSITSEKVQFLINNPPLVMEYKGNLSLVTPVKSVDLFKDVIPTDILNLDPSKFEYPKYDKALIDKYRKLYMHPTIKELFMLLKSDDNNISLYTVILGLDGIHKDIVNRSIVTTLQMFLDTSNKLPDTIDENFLYCINAINNIADIAEYIASIRSIIDVKDNCFDIAVEILKAL